MAMRPENLRFILGLKLRTLRQEQNASLKEVSERSGLSVSYLSEIEKGKKYPSPDKLLGLADAFNVTYDDLVSLTVDDKLDPLKEMFSSPFIQEFPFELFGLAPHDVFSLVSDAPSKAGALIRTFLEVGRTYDMQVEHFLFAALRSYQQLHDNYFPDLEDAADAFRRNRDWARTASLSDATLRSVLEDTFGYAVDLQTLPEHDTLHPFRSVFVDAEGTTPPTLYVNGDLMPIQRAFIYAREIGYNVLDVDERARTSSWIRAESFEQVLNNFRASYFAGALILNESSLLAALRSWFDTRTWDDGAFLRTQMERFQATPEMLYYRLTQLAPHHFDLTAFFFLRFHHEQGSPDYHLTKMLNLSGIPVPHGIGLREHYCQRWPAIQLLMDLSEAQAADDYSHDPHAPAAVRAQRSHFINADAEFFTLSTARPLALQDTTNSCVSIGFLMDDAFRREVQFAHDPSIQRREVNLTCERCPLSNCQERVAPATLHRNEQREKQQIEALRTLTASTHHA